MGGVDKIRQGRILEQPWHTHQKLELRGTTPPNFLLIQGWVNEHTWFPIHEILNHEVIGQNSHFKLSPWINDTPVLLPWTRYMYGSVADKQAFVAVVWEDNGLYRCVGARDSPGVKLAVTLFSLNWRSVRGYCRCQTVRQASEKSLKRCRTHLNGVSTRHPENCISSAKHYATDQNTRHFKNNALNFFF